MLSAIPKELCCEERTVFRIRVFNKGTLIFEWGIGNGQTLPSSGNSGFMESKKFDEQTRENSAFDWLSVSCAVCRLGNDRYSDNYMNFDYPKQFFHED